MIAVFGIIHYIKKMAQTLQSNLNLIIGQWENSPRLRALVKILQDILVEDALPALENVQLMRQIATARGVHLDAIGRRLGMNRPTSSNRILDPRFGFDKAGQPFDTVPFAGTTENDALFPMPDENYKRFLQARVITLLSDGRTSDFVRAVHIIDQSAVITDLRNMKLRIITNFKDMLQQADQIGALPRNAGVEIVYADRDRFGFDQAGVAYDQGAFANA